MGARLLASIQRPAQEAEQALGVHALELLHLESIPQGSHRDAAQAEGLPLPRQGRCVHGRGQRRWLQVQGARFSGTELGYAAMRCLRFQIRGSVSALPCLARADACTGGASSAGCKCREPVLLILRLLSYGWGSDSEGLHLGVCFSQEGRYGAGVARLKRTAMGA